MSCPRSGRAVVKVLPVVEVPFAPDPLEGIEGEGGIGGAGTRLILELTTDCAVDTLGGADGPLIGV